MDKRTYDIWNDDDGAEEEGTKSPAVCAAF